MQELGWCSWCVMKWWPTSCKLLWNAANCLNVLYCQRVCVNVQMWNSSCEVVFLSRTRHSSYSDRELCRQVKVFTDEVRIYFISIVPKACHSGHVIVGSTNEVPVIHFQHWCTQRGSLYQEISTDERSSQYTQVIVEPFVPELDTQTIDVMIANDWAATSCWINKCEQRNRSFGIYRTTTEVWNLDKGVEPSSEL